MTRRPTFAVVLRRKNGRYVKRLETAPSRYAAKQLLPRWREVYDDTYVLKIEDVTGQVEHEERTR